VKTGPHSFRDPTGVEWHIKGPSKVCGPGYVDAWSEDGKAVTVRPVAYLAAAGLALPDTDPGIPEGSCPVCTKELEPSGACFECEGPSALGMIEVEPGEWAFPEHA
jgi:hypothetical protein